MNYEYLVHNISERTNELSLYDQYDSTRREIIVTEQDMTDVDTVLTGDGILFELQLGFMMFMIDFILETLSCFEDEDLGFFITLFRFRNKFKEIKENKDRYKEYEKEVVNCYNELISLVKENEKIREEFNRCYQKFVDKFDSDVGLSKVYNDINSVCYDDVRESGLVKVKRKK